MRAGLRLLGSKFGPRFSTNSCNSSMEGPIHTAIFSKLSSSLNPNKLEIVNESHKHAHHSAMRGVESKETHFKLFVVSDEFKNKSLMQRHRMIYEILADEMVEGKVHALSLKTKTPEEVSA